MGHDVLGASPLLNMDFKIVMSWRREITEVSQKVSEMAKKEITVVGGLLHGRRRRKRKKVKKMNGRRKMIEEEEGGMVNMSVGPLVRKYWFQRYNLFWRYDQGIQMDEEGWYSVTPEEIAIRHAKMCHGRSVIDCFAGVGGNSIQFAQMCHHVVAIDIDPQKVALAMHNAKIYGVEDRIDFVIGDFFKLAPSLKGDVVYLSPPWGGPSYKSAESFTLDLLKPKDGYSLFQAAQMITPNIIMFLPRNVDLNQVEQLSWLSSPPLDIQIEKNYVDDYYLKGITAYFGNFASD